MSKRFTDFIIRITNIKTLAVSVAVIIAIQTAFSMLMPAFTEATGGTILDLSVAYSADFAYERLITFEKASDIYFKIRAVDFFYPIAYAFTLSVLSCFIYRKKYDDPDNYRWILNVPFLAALIDYVENIILVVLYRSLPVQYLSAAKVLNVATILKFGLLGFSVLLFVTGGFSLLKGGDSMLLMGNKFKGEKKDPDKK